MAYRKRRRIAWERVIAAIVLAACLPTWIGNVWTEQQYQVDLLTTYRGLR